MKMNQYNLICSSALAMALMMTPNIAKAQSQDATVAELPENTSQVENPDGGRDTSDTNTTKSALEDADGLRSDQAGVTTENPATSDSIEETTDQMTDSEGRAPVENTIPEEDQVLLEGEKHYDGGTIPSRVWPQIRYIGKVEVHNPNDQDVDIKMGVAHLGDPTYLIWEGRGTIPANTQKLLQVEGRTSDASNQTNLLVFNESNVPVTINKEKMDLIATPVEQVSQLKIGDDVTDANGSSQLIDVTFGDPSEIVVPLELSNTPDRITLQIPENPAEQMNINWYAKDNLEDAVLLVSEHADMSNAQEFLPSSVTTVQSQYYGRNEKGNFVYKVDNMPGRQVEDFYYGYFTADQINRNNTAWTGGFTGNADIYIHPLAEEHAYKAEATGLSAGTTYYYQVGSPSRLGGLSEIYSFTTASGNSEDEFVFIHYTDTQNAYWNENVRNEASFGADTIQAAVELVEGRGEKVNFAVHTGDIVEVSSSEDEWVDLLNQLDGAARNLPTVYVPGNHDAYLQSFNEHFNVPLPKGEAGINAGSYYSVDYNGMHIAVVNTNDSVRNPKAAGNPEGKAVSDEQLAWLDADLQAARANPDTNWLVVAFHKPLFSSSYHSLQDSDVQKSRVELFEVIDRNDVDLVMNGHDHVLTVTQPLVHNAGVFANGEIDANMKVSYDEDGNPIITSDGTIFLIPNTAGTKLYDDIYNTSLEHIKHVRPRIYNALGSTDEERQANLDHYNELFIVDEQPNVSKYFETSHSNKREGSVQNFAVYTVNPDSIKVEIFELAGEYADSPEREPYEIASFTIAKNAADHAKDVDRLVLPHFELETSGEEDQSLLLPAGGHIDFGRIPHRVQSGNRYRASAEIINDSAEAANLQFGVAHLGDEGFLIWDGEAQVDANHTQVLAEAVAEAYDSSNDTSLVLFNRGKEDIRIVPGSIIFEEKPYTEEEIKEKIEDLYASLPEPSLDFRVKPYLQSPSSTSIAINWVSEFETPGTVTIKNKETGEVHTEVTASPIYLDLSEYTIKEIEEHISFNNGNGITQSLEQGSWLMSNKNYKSEVDIINLQANTEYEYTVKQGESTFTNSFKTFPTKENWDKIRLVAFSDTETEPKGRLENREWEMHAKDTRYAEGSEERPEMGSAFQQKYGHARRRDEDLVRYPLTQAVALDENIKHIEAANPDALIIAGDLTQGAGYQPAWDEFWRHFAGEFSDIASSTPLITALGNWETYASINGGYQNAAESRNKYHDYMDTPGDEANPQYKDSYYRTDIGPITLITLDSTKGLPHETTGNPVGAKYSGDDSILKEELWHTAQSIEEVLAIDSHFTSDTQGSFTWEEYTKMFTDLYPELTAKDLDLPGFNPGTEQWLWAMREMEDARNNGQIILVQFHHAPYSVGVHGVAPNFESPDNQSGVAMRVYTPMFEKYEVAVVIAGHDEMFERSFVDKDGDGTGFHVYDVGVAADGLRSEKMVKNEAGEYVPVGYNTHSQWSATAHAPEMWRTNENGVKHLIDGGLHYGHLQIDLEKTEYGSKMTLEPVYIFPILDDNYDLVRTERRVYDDITRIYFDEQGHILKEEPSIESPTEPGEGSETPKAGAETLGSQTSEQAGQASTPEERPIHLVSTDQDSIIPVKNTSGDRLHVRIITEHPPALDKFSELQDADLDLFDITYRNAQGNEVSPQGPIQVTIQKDRPLEVIAVYHLGDHMERIRPLDFTQDANTVTFVTDDFSYFAIKYATALPNRQAGRVTVALALASPSADPVQTQTKASSSDPKSSPKAEAKPEEKVSQAELPATGMATNLVAIQVTSILAGLGLVQAKARKK